MISCVFDAQNGNLVMALGVLPPEKKHEVPEWSSHREAATTALATTTANTTTTPMATITLIDRQQDKEEAIHRWLKTDPDAYNLLLDTFMRE